MESLELLELNLAIEPDLQNFVVFLIESVRHLRGNAFRAASAILGLNQRLRDAGACRGQYFPVSIHLQEHRLRVCWPEHDLEVATIGTVDQSEIEHLRDKLRNSTEAIDPEILMQRNEAMMRHLDETRNRAEKELAKLHTQLAGQQEELQVSIFKSETDPLTKLPNRRAFDERLGKAFRYTMRQRITPLSLVMLDLDYFKRVNDEFGHLFGDAYLNKMAHILSSVIREDVDCAFRFGGDEFAMMIHADFATACEKSRLVMQQMEAKVSIGIASIDKYTPVDFTLEDFINKADSALYEAKRRGRGRVVVSQCDRADTHDCESLCSEKVSSD